MPRTSCTGRRAALLALAAVVLPVAACASGGSAGSTPRDDAGGRRAIYPGTEWARTDPAEAGFDPAGLEQIAADAEAHGSNCLVVVRHGRIAAEWYWNGTTATSTQDVFSTTKSVTSTLVGIAQDRGDLDIDDLASDYIPSWEGTPSAEVTVEDILANVSGRHWDGTSDYQGLISAQDRTGFAVGLGQDAPPGTTWFYNNSAIQTLDAVLEEATGQDPATYAQENLLDPLGMAHSEMTLDGAGNTNLFFGLRSTCEDMARFGYLFLRQGRWEDSRVVPRRWVRAATGHPSQELNAAYSYLWWLNRRGPVVSDPLESTSVDEAAQAEPSQIAEGAPEDIYWAWGLGGQVVQVHPASDTVVVRLAGPQETGYGRADTTRVVTEALVDR
jgi:CubicO group peptidase (beta-lactamase class C family)